MCEGYPPGYGFVQEWKVGGILFGFGVIFSFYFFVELYDAYIMLAVYEQGHVVGVLEGAVAKPFLQLIDARRFVPFFLFQAVMAVYHYFYYYQGAKSIYLMRRLPRGGVLIKSCVFGPLLCGGAGAVAAATLHLLYYFIYLLVIPGECRQGWGLTG